MGLVQNIICLFLTLQPISQASPIQAPDPDEFANKVQQSPDHNFCELPRVNGIGGTFRYLEDCENITNFENLPKPASDQDLGVHPYVCCPKYGAAVVCFPTDPWCPSFDAGTLDGLAYETGDDETAYEDEYGESYDYSEEDYEDYGSNVDYFDPEKEPKVSENVCPNRFKGSHDASSTCVNYKDCEGVLTEDISEVDVCGWDESERAVKVCCPKASAQAREQHDVAPRYTETSGNPYPCDDKADYVSRGMCRKWKRNGGCDIDKHFELAKDSPEDIVTSHEMFHFMMMSCMKTCRRCSACQDQHPKCRTWAKNNMCSLNPWFMGHTCRESCGVCGFLSPFSKKIQKVGDKTYSDIRDDNFDCGRTKLHEEVTNSNIDDDIFDLKRKKRQVTGDSDDDVFFSTESQDNEYSCGAIIVADRWAVAAAHCYPNFGVPVEGENRKIKLKVIRDYEDSPYLEHLEVKRVYIHPKYKYPNLYNDIAVVELGRRIEYDFEKYGDSPACLNKDENIIGKLAEVQGYGFNEDGDRGKLQVAENLKIITHEECRDIFRYNITGRRGDKRKLQKALPNGLNDQLLCAQGLINVTTGVFPGSCKGDSGGPLFLYPDERQTLVGIVSGGIGCGKGYPGWYTKASFFARWIICVMESSVSLNNDHDAIQEHCQRYTKDGSVDRSNWLD